MNIECNTKCIFVFLISQIYLVVDPLYTFNWNYILKIALCELPPSSNQHTYVINLFKISIMNCLLKNNTLVLYDELNKRKFIDNYAYISITFSSLILLQSFYLLSSYIFSFNEIFTHKFSEYFFFFFSFQ